MAERNPKWDRIYRNFKLEFPLIEEEVMDWWPSGWQEITVKLGNGNRISYDDIKGLARNLKPDSNPLTISDEDWCIYFSRKLREKMYMNNVDNQTLADALGVSRPMVSRYLNGHSTPSIIVLHKMARFLDCSLSELTEFPDID